MKVKVRTEFKDKYTGELYKAGKELEMTVERVNEVLKVGGFIEILDETKQATETAEQGEQTAGEEAAADEAKTEAPKTTRRKRSGK